ncbi:tetratricopeptide repeat protein [Winogradskyella helgolandensis]|uniref:tetratricopeptide repeat protein n=1 Tax=Winogradskyella helgolandensis TaxID=2697010 RepID=UPI0015C8F90D|nr:tetratricopeptide repeat protein [Winogradskyella helgolandensis]
MKTKKANVIKCVLPILSICFLILSCKKTETIEPKSSIQLSLEDSLRVNYFKGRAYRQNLYSQEFQKYLDSALQVSPSDAHLWQQKAMACFKSKKYEVGMGFLDKAVALDTEYYIDYRAFIKCIFTKQYKASIVDFKKAKQLLGSSYIMDHTYDFYLGLCYLQLNEFEKANRYFRATINSELEEHDESWIHYLDWFYYGISEFELGNYDKAIVYLDKSLVDFPKFSDAQYYKIKCLARIGKIDEAKDLLKIGIENIELGHTIFDSNSQYETYPYQISEKQFKNFVD